MSLEQKPISSDLVPIRDRLETSSVVEIAGFFKNALDEEHLKNPGLSPYGLLKIVASNLPLKIHDGIRQKAVKAMGSEDEGVRTAGGNAFLFLSLKTIFTVVDSNFAEERDTDENREDMLSSAIISVMRNAAKINQKIKIPSQVYSRAQLGIFSYLCEEHDMPLHKFVPDMVKMSISFIREIAQLRSLEGFTGEEVGNFVQELSGETGVPVSDIFNYLTHGRAFGKNTTGMIESSEEDEPKGASGKIEEIQDPKAHGVYENVNLEIDMREILKILSGQQRKVVEQLFGLGGNVRETEEEIGRKLGIVKTAVSATKRRALNKLRRPPARKKIEGYHFH